MTDIARGQGARSFRRDECVHQHKPSPSRGRSRRELFGGGSLTTTRMRTALDYCRAPPTVNRTSSSLGGTSPADTNSSQRMGDTRYRPALLGAWGATHHCEHRTTGAGTRVAILLPARTSGQVPDLITGGSRDFRNLCPSSRPSSWDCRQIARSPLSDRSSGTTESHRTGERTGVSVALRCGCWWVVVAGLGV